jgi:adenylate kinase
VTILVAGPHGVGKTYLAKPVAEGLGLCYATASQLIREERGRATWTTTRQVAEIDENQAALVRAVARVLGEGEQLLLDGHLVLRSRPQEHQRLSAEVFRALQCRRIIVLTAPVSLLLSRLKARGDETWAADELAAFTEAELQHGKEVAAKLGVPLFILKLPTADEFRVALLS